MSSTFRQGVLVTLHFKLTLTAKDNVDNKMKVCMQQCKPVISLLFPLIWKRLSSVKALWEIPQLGTQGDVICIKV